jgi:hypothetical protein
MKNLNLLVVCSIMGDALASKMALASKRGTMSNLMALLKDCPTLLRARLPCLRITRVTFYTLPVTPRAKLGEFILESLTLALIMLLCIRVRHLDLGNCSIPKIQILKFSQTRSKFKMNFKFHFKMFVCELISANKL